MFTHQRLQIAAVWAIFTWAMFAIITPLYNVAATEHGLPVICTAQGLIEQDDDQRQVKSQSCPCLAEILAVSYTHLTLPTKA